MVLEFSSPSRLDFSRVKASFKHHIGAMEPFDKLNPSSVQKIKHLLKNLLGGVSRISISKTKWKKISSKKKVVVKKFRASRAVLTSSVPPSLSLFHKHTHSLSHTRTPMHTHSLTHTRKHTYTRTLSQSSLLSPSFSTAPLRMPEAKQSKMIVHSATGWNPKLLTATMGEISRGG